MSRDPRQLELFPGESKKDVLYRQFEYRILDKLSHSDPQKVIQEMRAWGEVHEMPLVANWVRKVLRGLKHQAPAPNVLETFGYAFRGDVVGSVGRDLLVAPLQAADPKYREAAVNVLCLWLQYDEEGMWLEMADRHLETEDDEELRFRLNTAINVAYGDEEVLEDEEDDLGTVPDAFLDVRYNTKTEVRAIMFKNELPGFLEKLIGLSLRDTVGFVETLKVGQPCVQSPNIDLHLGPQYGSCVLYAWEVKGQWAMTLEKATAPDRYVVELFF